VAAPTRYSPRAETSRAPCTPTSQRPSASTRAPDRVAEPKRLAADPVAWWPATSSAAGPDNGEVQLGPDPDRARGPAVAIVWRYAHAVEQRFPAAAVCQWRRTCQAEAEALAAQIALWGGRAAIGHEYAQTAASPAPGASAAWFYGP
jgi:hypothetical protein